MFPNQTDIDDSYDLLGNVNDEALESVDMSLDDFNKGKGKEKVDGKDENGFQLVCSKKKKAEKKMKIPAIGKEEEEEERNGGRRRIVMESWRSEIEQEEKMKIKRKKSMGVVMVEDVMIFTKDWPILKAFSDGIGVAVYAFEG
ncbi:hypothetical protein LWI29_027485 [Acer saccharum]|uniref:Uncharacterized protein n=1 Tax=Acer saccharum TaxID=4024 RepID=A0AA39VL30_ACESA|nr:hypothetical protein LWI29_027485 [Acer saccharum]